MTTTTIINVEGLDLECEQVQVEYVDGRCVCLNLKPGDTYIASRKGRPWKIGTVSEKLWDKSQEMGCIFASEMMYPFDWHECLKVVGGL